MIEALIKNNVIFTKTSPSGWDHCRCPLCNDHSDRAGFKFTHECIIFSCFNCGRKGVYEQGAHRMSNKMKEYLSAFGLNTEVVDTELSKLYFLNQGVDKDNLDKILASTKSKYDFEKVLMPKESYLVEQENYDTDIRTQVAIEYLASRGFKPTDYTWYVSSSEEYSNYLIIPIFKNGKLIYWQGRAFLDSAKERFKNPVVSKDNILYGYDVLQNYNIKRVFVTEGLFNSIGFPNTISTIGASIPKMKVDILKSFNKEIIFVIDKDVNGKKVSRIAKANGFKITHLDTEDDINSSIKRYGKLYTLNTLLKNIKSDFEIDLFVELFIDPIIKE